MFLLGRNSNGLSVSRNSTMTCVVSPGWRYKLHIARGEKDVVILEKSALVSVIHKCIRRGHDSLLCDVLKAFFFAMGALGSDEQCAMKGSVTNIVNRFATALLEDGPLLVMAARDPQSSQPCKLVVSLLLHLRKQSRDKEWASCSKTCSDIMEIVQEEQVHRIRYL